jgi:ferric-dicitrate binding protein FerR (iron transport regulator)
MSPQHIIKKYLEGNCTPEEIAFLYEYLQHSQVREHDALLEQVWTDLQTHPTLSRAKSDKIYSNISETITAHTHQFRLIRNWSYVGLAASVLLAIGAVLFFRGGPNLTEVATAYQETRSLQLPDGTQVTLNANSKIRFPEQIASLPVREVWIEGEAFFHVNSRQEDGASGKVPFVVHTELVDINVLGTQFNVKDRHGKAEVVLKEGKISLSSFQGNLDQQLEMKPGQKVLVDSQTGLQVSEVDDPGLYSSWKENELYFDNEPLAEIARELEDEYGIEVAFSDDQIGKLKFTGSAPADALDVLFISMEKSFNLNIQKNEDQYLISRP